MADHPDIKIKVEVADWNSYRERLKVQIAGGTPPESSRWTRCCSRTGRRAGCC